MGGGKLRAGIGAAAGSAGENEEVGKRDSGGQKIFPAAWRGRGRIGLDGGGSTPHAKVQAYGSS